MAVVARPRSPEASSLQTVSITASAGSALAGDILIARTGYWMNVLLLIPQWLLLLSILRKFVFWNHAAVFIDSNGNIVEAVNGEIALQHVSKYQGSHYRVVHVDVSDEGRQRIAQYAFSHIGRFHRPLAAIQLALACLTGAPSLFRINSNYVGAGLVINSLTYAGVALPIRRFLIFPGTLASALHVDPPSKDERTQVGQSANNYMARIQRSLWWQVMSGIWVIAAWLALLAFSIASLLNFILCWIMNGSPDQFENTQPLRPWLSQPAIGIPSVLLAVGTLYAGLQLMRRVESRLDARIRRQAEEQLITAKRETLYLLQAASMDSEPTVRTAAIRVLGDLYFDEARRIIVGALDDDDPRPRLAAFQALRQSSSPAGDAQ